MELVVPFGPSGRKLRKSRLPRRRRSRIRIFPRLKDAPFSRCRNAKLFLAETPRRGAQTFDFALTLSDGACQITLCLYENNLESYHVNQCQQCLVGDTCVGVDGMETEDIGRVLFSYPMIVQNPKK